MEASASEKKEGEDMTEEATDPADEAAPPGQRLPEGS